MDRMDKLKPCPFCGKKPTMKHIKYYTSNIEFWFVRCEKCDAEINRPRATEKNAICDWNKRIGKVDNLKPIDYKDMDDDVLFARIWFVIAIIGCLTIIVCEICGIPID